MADKFLAKESLQAFLSELGQIGTVNGPTVNRYGVISFNPVSSASDLRLDYQRTLLPPKKYLLPPRETILQFTPTDGYSQPVRDEEKTVLFGIHSCDLAGIGYLDRVFLSDRPDPGYQSKREKLVLIGISCDPDEFCFCGELPQDSSSVPYDLFLYRVEGGFILRHGSTLGRDLISRLDFLKKTDLHPPKVRLAEAAKCIAHAVRQKKQFEGSPLWNDFAERCLSCGACSLCCPTCYCVDVREYGALDERTAERLQEWDNCLFKSHGEVAGGTNFRRTRQERFHYRFLHKYYGFGPLRGLISCVGCGRCREVCPVRIDLLELFREK